ncbi:hypothetical protein GJU40_08060 [Bacillus lacus]|uniref:Lipoprotein n=1 Tax=Metabacillus lacus TaxID=1983721 RepID=A0A7X2IYR8_9BACI|nr:hypothetical protein [Metabacillus lacus]MRX72114.1 hypothetical protein [Metabacillus lacus]
MKKLLIMIITLLIVTVSACEDGSSKQVNTLAAADLTDREQGILAVITDKSYIFDFTIDPQYKKAAVGIEKYEFGRLISGGLTLEVDVGEQGSIIFAVSEAAEHENQQIFRFGINSEGSSASGSQTDSISEKGREVKLSTWASSSQLMDVTENEMVLAAMIYSFEKNSINSFSEEFFKDAEVRESELKNKEAVYLFKCKFTK